MEDYIVTKIEIMQLYLEISYYISLGIILIMIIIVFPILLQSRKKIERVLFLFTTIQRHQVFYYYTHFERTMEAFRNINQMDELGMLASDMSSSEARRKEKKLYKRDAQSTSISKRRFKNLKFNYMAFFFALLLIGSFFFIFLLLKDYT
jgi:hypothetical protein